MGKTDSLLLTQIIPARFKSRKRWRWLLFFFSFLFFSLLFFSFASPCQGAMSLTFSGAPLTVEEEEVFAVQVVLSSAPTNRLYFLRAAFSKEGESQYFGETLNHQGEWHHSPAEHLKFLEINTGDQGEWAGALNARADLEAVGWQGPGEYLFKVGRYTEGGSLSWSDNEEKIAIVVRPSPTPTPSLTPTPDPTSTPTPVSTPWATFSPTPTPILTPTPTPYRGGGISLNEFLPYPAEGEEWVEIKNENDFEVHLVDWFLDDIADGGSRPLKFSLEIVGGGLGVVYAGTRFNNSGDWVRLIGQSGEEIETYPYTRIEKGYSWAKNENGNWDLTFDPTPGEENRIIGLASATPIPSPTLGPTLSPTTKPLIKATTDPFPAELTGSSSVLGLSGSLSLSSDETATDSGSLAGFMCPWVEELEKDFSVLKTDLLTEEQDNDRFKSGGQGRPLSWYVCLLGLVAMIGSWGFFLKEAGFLVKWEHGLVVKS